MVDWLIFAASGESPTVCLEFTELICSSASKLKDGVEATLIADMKATDQYIVCHVMCDDIGELRGLVIMCLADLAKLGLPDGLRSSLICLRVCFRKLQLKEISQKLRWGPHRIPLVTESGIYLKARPGLLRLQMHSMVTICKLMTFWPCLITPEIPRSRPSLQKLQLMISIGSRLMEVPQARKKHQRNRENRAMNGSLTWRTGMTTDQSQFVSLMETGLVATNARTRRGMQVH